MISDVSEFSSLLDCLQIIFEHPAPWDRKHQYTLKDVHKMKIYYPAMHLERYHDLAMVDQRKMLKDITAYPDFTVVNGILVFMVFPKDSDGRNHFQTIKLQER